jgi:hypothetical protein
MKMMNKCPFIKEFNFTKLNMEKLDVEVELSVDGYDTIGDNYDYLLDMAIGSLTKEHREQMERKIAELNIKLEKLKKTTVTEIWWEELYELETFIKKCY